MIALIKKDIFTMRKTLLITILTSIALIVYGIWNNAVYMVPLLCIMMPIILNAISFGYDSRAKFEKFAFSMPIKKTSYVYSKLFYSFFYGTLGAVSCLVYLILEKNMPFINAILISILMLLSSLLVTTIQLPFVLKFGEEKGRLIMVITYFLIFATSTLLKDKTDWAYKLFQSINKLSFRMVVLAIILIMAILIASLVSFSVRVLDKKEY